MRSYKPWLRILLQVVLQDPPNAPDRFLQWFPQWSPHKDARPAYVSVCGTLQIAPEPRSLPERVFHLALALAHRPPWMAGQGDSLRTSSPYSSDPSLKTVPKALQSPPKPSQPHSPNELDSEISHHSFLFENKRLRYHNQSTFRHFHHVGGYLRWGVGIALQSNHP